MDEKKTQNVYNGVKILIKEQKIQSTKILELEKKFDIIEKINARLKKLENTLDDEKDQTDNRFDNVIERFDNCDSAIAELENKFSDITKNIYSI